MLKIEGEKTKKLVEKFKEVRVQTLRQEVMNVQYSINEGWEAQLDKMYMDTESL